ncbi:MAG: Crp/Fnr family transcriptional regulator [Cyclobacteriaceae bacterium]|nr:Crp/Fnr family transcriptional regulator [Cyclobacteriaceae bacterium]
MAVPHHLEHLINPKFKSAFVDSYGFTEDEYALLLSYFDLKYVKKKEFYARAGIVCKHKTYLNKGCMRNFTIDEQGHERVLFFHFEDWWVGDFDSFYSGKPSVCNFQALEDCEILEITQKDFNYLKTRIPKLNIWLADKHTKKAIANSQKMVEIKTLSLEERYERLLCQEPEVVNRIPLQYIASYLNVEPQSLSRVRKNIQCKKK